MTSSANYVRSHGGATATALQGEFGGPVGDRFVGRGCPNVLNTRSEPLGERVTQ